MSNAFHVPAGLVFAILQHNCGKNPTPADLGDHSAKRIAELAEPQLVER